MQQIATAATVTTDEAPPPSRLLPKGYGAVEPPMALAMNGSKVHDARIHELYGDEFFGVCFEVIGPLPIARVAEVVRVLRGLECQRLYA